METPKQQIAVRVAGHEVKLELDPEETPHVEKAAKQVTDRISSLTARMSGAPAARVAAMVAFQFACDLSIANELLDEAEKVHEELQRQKEAVARLEKLLARVDDALVV